MNVLVAPDSFKETLTAPEAARAMAAGARRIWPEAKIVLRPLADGGEGTTEVLVAATGGHIETRDVTGPLGSFLPASYGLLGPDGATAIVEMAQAAGLSLVPPDRRDPRTTTTYGVGELLRAAADTGAKTIIVGLGGSATNDGGAGAMQALGVRFLDSAGWPLPFGGAALARLARIDVSGLLFPRTLQVIAASDVRNPLTGPQGASAVYGPQKGADAATVAELDAALTHYAAILRHDLGHDIAAAPGAGAAGGLGAALSAFLQATFRSGIDVVLDAGDFAAQARNADWVLTGEGRIDAQTLSGKTISGVLARCQAVGVPVIAFGGVVEAAARAALRGQGLWDAVPLVTGEVTLEEALRDPARVLAEAVSQVIAGLGKRSRQGRASHVTP